MDLKHDDVKKIATLARLRLTPEEESLFASQLTQIVHYFDHLSELPVSTPEAGSRRAPEAEDLPGICLPTDRFLANAPQTLDAFLVVPEVKGPGVKDGGSDA